MKTKTCLAGIFLVAALADAETVTRQQLVFASNAPVILTATATNDLNSALQRGLFEEEGNRDLPAAISAYQSLAAQFDQSRQVVAMVIFRLGECYRKLGRTNEAVAQYERIGREFSDQQTLATLSRQNLARLNVRETTPASTTNADAELLAKLKKLSPSELEQVLPTLMPDNALATLLQERNTARQDRVKLSGTKTYDHPEIQNQDALIKELDNRIHERINGILLAMEIRAGQLQAAGVADKETPAGADDEDKEIRRLQAMLQNSPDLVNSTSQGAAPLQQAAGAGQLRVSVFLLDHGAKINLKSGGQTALHGATENGNKEMVKLLLDRGADVNATDGTGGTALHSAAERGFLSVAEVLLAHHADMNARNSESNGRCTPLHLAAVRGNVEMLKLLITYGADLNARSTSGSTPLSHAAQAGQLDCLQALLAVGGNPNFKDDKGETPLLSAIQNGRSEGAALLIQHGADVNGTNDNGMTPLMMAVWKQSVPMISLLLSNKVDINTRHPSGRTALLMSEEAEGGWRPYTPGNYGGSGLPPDRNAARKISALLREHGALGAAEKKP